MSGDGAMTINKLYHIEGWAAAKAAVLVLRLWRCRNLTELQRKCSAFISLATTTFHYSPALPRFRYRLFWSAKILIRIMTSIYSGKFRIVDYYTSIVYTVQYALHILHFKVHFCTTKKFTIKSA
ncbi:agip7 [Agrotis ipsilon multiple nucleopolyhedrovirus]|uniref:Uncharacterized protein n=1 Tax=Agrotis ipsilon multiple nucleopolyhedrovirus TaxID=208013 RepID=B6D5S1_9ABAC|nr:agip7 [Agrotis ipsilon multiple nucleopolyhedrovirus]ACI28709.1 unknown [Agrotis ipsilon multiple nucleopolyhedrovirus]